MNIWNFIQEKLARNIDVMLLIVLESSGSSPGRQGFKMVVTKNKELSGSIGGGGMEFEMVELAYAMLNSGNRGSILKKQVHSDDGGQDNDGMICNGMQTIAFYPMNKSNLSAVKKISNAFEISKQGIIKVSNNSIEFIKDKTVDLPFLSKITDENNWEYQEKPGRLNRVCIIGAGHVGLALSKLMKELDFTVEIYDDRLGLNTFENNEYVNKKLKINYNDIDKLIPEGDNVYIVIMTFGHESDELVLEKLIHKEVRYLGMMGSRTKVEKIFHDIGFVQNKDEKRKVYAPIGISIKSQTPAEIAISIAAQIIKIKNEHF